MINKKKHIQDEPKDLIAKSLIKQEQELERTLLNKNSFSQNMRMNKSLNECLKEFVYWDY